MSEATKSSASSISNTNTEVGIAPHASTVRTDAWVPFHKFGEGDLIVAGKLAAQHAFGCGMKLFTVRHHTRLRGCRVSMPLPAVVVVAGFVVVIIGRTVVVDPPMMPTQTLTSACMPEQSLLTVGFHATKSARVIFW